MARRLHIARLAIGKNALPDAAAHHARDVLRLTIGDELELFDDSGATAIAKIIVADATGVCASVETIRSATTPSFTFTIASAVPKGNRADWMIEKLSELGTGRFIPLKTARSVVHPEGEEKRARWARLATEAARQSRRTGVMEIDELTPLAKLLEALNPKVTWVLATETAAIPIQQAARNHQESSLTILIGPEGGWSADELAIFEKAGIVAVRLTETILRIETAALAMAAIAGAIITPAIDSPAPGSGTL